MSAGNAPPRLAPRTSASAPVGPTTCVTASDATSSTMAMLEWQAQVSAAATSTARTGSPSREPTTGRSNGVFSIGPSVCRSPASAISISPRPMPTRPMFFARLPAAQRKRSTPTSTKGGPTRATLNDSTWVNSAVPMLAPSMTASAGASAITPVAVNEVASRPVAVLLWSNAVTPSPVRNARNHVRPPEEEAHVAREFDE